MPNTLMIAPPEDAYQTIQLAIDEREYLQVSELAKGQLSNLASKLEVEVQRVLSNQEIAVELTACNASGLDSWLQQTQRLLLNIPMLSPNECTGYLAIDFQSIYQLAELSLGGQTSSDSKDSAQERTELSKSEIRIANRLAQTQFRAIQSLLVDCADTLPSEPVKQIPLDTPFQYLTFKVRLLTEQEITSWFIWVPVELFSPAEETVQSTGPVMGADMWRSLPVNGLIEMGKKQLSVEQLSRFINGELLPVTLATEMALKVGDIPLFSGKVVEHQDKLMFQIELILDTDNYE